MTATSLNVYTDVLTNPEWQTGQIEVHRIDANLSFTYPLAFNIVTLSTHNAAPGEALGGLLYVPDLPTDDPCIAASAPYVPANVTRARNLPPVGNVEWVGIAPWLSTTCTLKYLAAAREGFLKTMLFFLPTDNSTVPPSADSEVWRLPQGYTENFNIWKQTNDFPVYAISAHSASKLLNASAQYSGNMTDVPYGHVLTEYYDSRDYVRLYVDIQTAAADNLPSLWIFLLVVLGIMLAIIGFTSLLMHWLQMRRRNSLRRRVANGEVDLEALGIKRLTVPQEILDEMPLYTYGSGEPAQLPTTTTTSDATPGAGPATAEKEESPPSTRPSSPAPAARPIRRSTYQSAAKPPHRPTSLQQPTCAICLDDFVPAGSSTGTGSNSNNTSAQGTIVREMPCQHIFHPECVDTFLRESSSLCPMCKKTALPTGYCPRVITNAMVRRERTVRRLRPRMESNSTAAGGIGEASRRSRVMTSNALGRFSSWNQERRNSSAPLPQHQDTEMTTPSHGAASSLPRRSATLPPIPDSATSPPPQPEQQQATAVQPPSNPRRREWARQRAVAMLGRHAAPVDPEAEEGRTMPGWRKALLGLFPGVAR